MSKYSDLLKSPQWQKRRLEVMERDKFQCRLCGDFKSTLNVHHTCYESGNNPWEYEDFQLLTLCEECHSKEHEFLEGIKITWNNLGINKYGVPTAVFFKILKALIKNKNKINVYCEIMEGNFGVLNE